MPMTGAQMRTQLADTARNPRAAVAGGRIVTIRLNMQNVAFVPETFYDALVTLYGAGKVSTDLDNTGRNSDHEFRIIP